MFYKYILIFLVILISNGSLAQIGGQRAFDFMNIPADARTAALGGVNVTLTDGDVNAYINNPALLDSSMTNKASLNYSGYLGGIKFSQLSYARKLKKYGLWGIGLKYLGYGSIEAFDETGLALGTFNSNEFALNIGHSRSSGNFSVGGNIKFASSNIASFRSYAILMDIGGVFQHPKKELAISMVLKNVGITLKDFTQLSQTSLPFDIQLGASFKPTHMPFRLSITTYNLFKADIAYFDPNGGGQQGSQINEPGVADKIFRHFIFATEFIPSKNFHVRIGYNHLMRKELRIETLSGGAGFSFGMLFRVKAFEFAYSKAFYHVAGSTNQLTITSDLSRVFKKKNEI